MPAPVTSLAPTTLPGQRLPSPSRSSSSGPSASGTRPEVTSPCATVDPSIAWNQAPSPARSEEFTLPDAAATIAVADQQATADARTSPVRTDTHSSGSGGQAQMRQTAIADHQPPMQMGVERPSPSRVAKGRPPIDPLDLQSQVTGSRRVTVPARLFTLLQQSVDQRTVGRFITRDAAGRACFDVGPVMRELQAQGEAANRDTLANMLGPLHPANLEAVLSRRQWEKVPPKRAEVRERLDRLIAEIPFAVFAPRNQMAAWINDRYPDSYCSTQHISRCLAAKPSNDEAADAAIERMIADRSIDLFFDPSACHFVDHGALVDYLHWRGLTVTSNAIDQILTARQNGLCFDLGSFMPLAQLAGAVGKHHAAVAMMNRLQLRPGMDMPPWNDFIEAFSAQFCSGEPGNKPLKLTGGAVMSVYTALERALVPDPTPTPTPTPTHVLTPTKRSQPPMPHVLETTVDGPRAKTSRSAVGLAAPTSRAVDSPVLPPAHGGPVRTLASGEGGLKELAEAMANAMQTLDASSAVVSFANRVATPDDAMVIAQTFAADGPGADTGWTTLKLQARHWQAVAGALLSDLDQAAVMRAGSPTDATGASPLQFVALRRDQQALYLLDHRLGMPVLAGQDEHTAGLTLAGGDFWAALPVASCRGTVSRLVSYAPIPGFAEACDAITGIVGGRAPLDDFTCWLDRTAQVAPDASHATAHAARIWTFGMIDFDAVASYLQHRYGIALRRQAPPLSRLNAQDAGKSVHDELEWRTAPWPDGAIAMLNLPVLGRMFPLRRIDGRLAVVDGSHAWPLDIMLATASTALGAGMDQPVELYQP
ncbi:hypothetical protein [Xylophilus sp. GOD-11R]|uniref:hypothetical protein n=1 Tax=Xylophilus sp. GOD-11R TaxID=3089814 RepID=UPI00298D52DF|nr:hypothetical protein [Xylophilus sp. GOD-11R]WPB56220.1 hypothetical protein R9X41_19055 [Xylophilus sp. GOD-11R]